ncbi:hypothetical protein LEMLEM_LOCUS25242 [Lemmus lemmus]
MQQDVAPPCREEQVPGFWAGGCGHSYNPQLTLLDRLSEPVLRGFRRVRSMNGALWPATVLRKALVCCTSDGWVLKIVARGTPPSLPCIQVPVSSLRPARHAAGPALLAQPWALPELF